MEFWEVVKQRHCVRKYTSKMVEKELLEQVLLSASMAPVGMGLYENIHLTVLTKKEILNKIDRAAAVKMGKEDAHPIYDVPVAIIVSSRPGKFVIPGIEEANCGCIMENMMLTATSLGLGSVYLLAATEAFCANEDIMKELEIPEGFRPIATLGLGYSATEVIEKEENTKIEVNYVA